MRSLLSNLVLAAGLVSLLVGVGPAEAKDKLTVYTYESFTADWGP
ncbi:MAG: thiamine ABC transporter substrate-binding protein, partial [Mesorhizobium sp.]